MAKQPMNLTDESRSPIRIILYLTWPLFLEQILTTLVSYADTAMVGVLGVNATASVSISNSFVFLINGVVMALGVGITAYVARTVGAGDYEEAKAYIRHALLLLAYVGVPISGLLIGLHRLIPQWMGAEPEILDTAANYLLITSLFRIFNLATMMLSGVFRGRGDTKTPLHVNMAVNLINVVGNYLLINPTHTLTLFSLSFTVPGAGLGVTGAALSTGLSWMVGGVLMVVLLYTKKDPTRISIRDSMRIDRALIRRVVDISIPAMLERFCMSTASIVVSRAVASLGTVVFAANSVYITAESISFMPGFAFATAATTLVGQALGAGKKDLAEKFAYKTVAVGAAILTFSGAMIYIFARQLVSLFTPDPDAIDLAIQCLHQVAFIQPIQVTAWILAGALRGAGDTKWPFYITAVCNWGIRTLGAFLCIRVFHLGLPEAVLCACADSTVRALLTWLRFRTDKWQTALTTE
ncbi:MAG: MATE family efflux transporter [Clostridia bacterium]|nr:MATE family efflux transporter [Clostridia bacterium]